MWHDMLDWLPTVTAIVRLFAAGINLSLSVRKLRARVSVSRREARHAARPEGHRTARVSKREKNRGLRQDSKSGARPSQRKRPGPSA
jgi:hypothetical protein